jgi:hypothetical protein
MVRVLERGKLDPDVGCALLAGLRTFILAFEKNQMKLIERAQRTPRLRPGSSSEGSLR